jgi:hypothetical protein
VRHQGEKEERQVLDHSEVHHSPSQLLLELEKVAWRRDGPQVGGADEGDVGILCESVSLLLHHRRNDK